MNDTNNKTSKKHGRGDAPKSYAAMVAIYTVIALVATVCVMLAVYNPAVSFVHRVEAAMPKSVCDLEYDENSEYLNYSEMKSSVQYGNLIANIACESKGLNADVYYGLNRFSMRYGAGMSGNAASFDDEGGTVVAGYDETYFAALKYIEKGDEIKVTFGDRVITYNVKQAKYVKSSEIENACDTDSGLVLYSIFSAFSENKESCYYVAAEKTGEEVGSNE